MLCGVWVGARRAIFNSKPYIDGYVVDDSQFWTTSSSIVLSIRVLLVLSATLPRTLSEEELPACVLCVRIRMSSAKGAREKVLGRYSRM